MKKTYELMLILSAQTGEEDAKIVIEKVKKFIDSDGKVLSEVALGKKAFAYPIRKEKDGIYWVFMLTALPSFIKSLQVKLAAEPNILRYLLTGKEQ